MIDKIVKNEISSFLKNECLIMEYKNPTDSETVRVIGDNLEGLYNKILANGTSKREVVMEVMSKIISEIRRLEQMMTA